MVKKVTITYYTEIISSWCHWAEPAWAELKARYADKVEFGWKIALLPAEATPVSRGQADWFYRRSGTVMRSPYMLNSGWYEAGRRTYEAPGLVAVAARQMGATGDTVRLALANAAVLEGKKVGQWDVAVAIAAKAGKLNQSKLLARAKSKQVADIVAKTTGEFHALQVTQRPAFLIENAIGDCAVFSGIVRIDPLAAAIEALLNDQKRYDSFAAHFGNPPKS